MGGQKLDYPKGYKINLLEVIEKTDKRNNSGTVLWKCYCYGCDNFCLIASDKLNKNNKKQAYSCGCYQYGDLLPGEKYGELTVVSKTNEKNKNRERLYLFDCSCGKNNIKLSGCRVKNGNTKSCGHLKYPDYTGQKFGDLLVLEKTKERASNDGVVYLCKCSCGKEIKVPISDLKKGQNSCGHLQISKGEILISNLLNKLNINFKQEKKFNDCRNLKTNYILRFDFYLPDYNACIEYDGEQHFKNKGNGWNTEEHLKLTQERDSIKNQYCKNNNLKLIRIPYWDYNNLNKEYIRKALSCPLMDLSKNF